MLFQRLAIVSAILTIIHSLQVFSYPKPTDIYITPDKNYERITREIAAAKKSIRIQNFHITHPEIVDSLIAKRKADPGVKIQVMMDKGNNPKIKEQLEQGKVEVAYGSPRFSITHSKMFVIDGKLSFISTINLTRHLAKTRDVGLFFEDKETADSLEKIFAMDWKNADSKEKSSPLGISDAIVLSPTNSRAKLTQFISGAKKSLKIQTENLVDMSITEEIIRAHKRGVDVDLVIPRCSLTGGAVNLRAAEALYKEKVNIRMMPHPSSGTVPYIHAKFMIADDKLTFVGSENFSGNSLDRAREIGVIAEMGPLAKTLNDVFESDLALAISYPKALPTKCPEIRFKPSGAEDEDFFFQEFSPNGNSDPGTL